MIDLTGHMYKLAKAVGEDVESQVYTFREVLTAVYQAGFQDGQLAEHKDRSMVEQIKTLRGNTDG